MKALSLRWANHAGLLMAVVLTAGCDETTPPAEKPVPPKLVVTVVLDGMRAETLEKYKDKFGSGGFKRLQNEGAHFSAAAYEHAATVTAAGHANIATGQYPRSHGIISNTWFEGGTVNAADDTSVTIVGKTGVGQSAKNLRTRALGEFMKETWPEAKVFSVALKNRASVLLAGKGAGAAYWLHTDGDWVTSAAYLTAYPAWVTAYNADKRSHIDKYFGTTWTPLLPTNQYPQPREDTSAYNPTNLVGLGKDFPHPITGGLASPGPAYYDAIGFSPYGGEATVEFVKALVENEQLGADDVPDLLAVSFSNPDGVNHLFGPTSWETADNTIRTDAHLQDFFNYLDSKVGLDRTLIVLTADHGFAGIPALVGGGKIDPAATSSNIESSLTAQYGALPTGMRWLSALRPPDLYLNPAALSAKSLSSPAVQEFLEGKIPAVPGLGFAIGKSKLSQLSLATETDPLKRALLLNLDAARSGDVVFVTDRDWSGPPPILAADHGSPHDYDSKVPLFFFGWEVKAGVNTSKASPVDIAPTLAKAMELPNFDNTQDSKELEIR